MIPDIEELLKLPKKASKDYLQLMHQALEMKDKEWFNELAKEKDRHEKREEEVRRELGWTGSIE